MKGGNPIQSAIPWLTYSSIDYIEKYLNHDMKVFEYGGGGSTLYFASRVAELVTVEHDTSWYEQLDRLMKSEHENFNWQGFLIPGKRRLQQTSDEQLDAANPDHYHSKDEVSKELLFYEYASKIEDFQPQSFDLILVDGRARPSCLKHAISRCKSGGLLVLDNSDRDYYTAQLEKSLNSCFDVVVDEYGPVPYLRNFSKTTVYRK